ncbi:hypothetical protein BBJ28_00003279 [Nothophytophthora sp. Chile5]|nr:hypothetical protein BBJ28_00003279 [Nothophytophthora sp. Chile5]
MVGWEIELESMDTQRLEHATIKRVDCDINCAFVVFSSGRKEWLDFTLFRVKVAGHPVNNSINTASCDVNHTDEASKSLKEQPRAMKDESPAASKGKAPSPRLADSAASPDILPMSLPTIASNDFDWQSEGTHVELCDHDGRFLEGAALCSKTQSHLQLYSEHREFFEVTCATQGFKVVIHGLQSLKTIPMGQGIDVYSPMAGQFRNGTILKTAVLGHLTPIRFTTDKTIEWFDLATQTFKLVFIPTGAVPADCPGPTEPSPQAQTATVLPHKVSTHEPSSHCHQRELKHRQFDHTSLKTEGPHEPPFYNREKPHQSHGSLAYPRLHVGQRIELLDDRSKQFQKYKVAAVNDWADDEYLFEPLATSSASLFDDQNLMATLSRLRSRLLLQPTQWREYRPLLVGHRVDVYDRIGKSILSGKIQAVGGDSGDGSDEPTVLVRYKDGRKVWVDLQTSKVKLRLHPTVEITPALVEATADTKSNADVDDLPATASASPASDVTASGMTHSILQPLTRISSGGSVENDLDPVIDAVKTQEAIGHDLQTPFPAVEQPLSVIRRGPAGSRMPPLRRRPSQAPEELHNPQEQPAAHLEPSHSEPSLLPASYLEPGSSASLSSIKPLNLSLLPNRQEDAALPSDVGTSKHSASLATGKAIDTPTSSPRSPHPSGRVTLPVGAIEAARQPNLSLVASDHEHHVDSVSQELHHVTHPEMYL